MRFFFLGVFILVGCVEQKKAPLHDIELVSSWFPTDVERVFTKAWEWSHKRPQWRYASRGVQLIEVKRLTREEGHVHETNLNWSSDGVYLGYEKTEAGIRTVSLKNLSGEFRKKIAVSPVHKGFMNQFYGFKTWNSGLRWSRLSNQYVFVSNGGAGQFDIYYGSVSAEDVDVALTYDNAKDGHASWSPSVDEVAYVSSKSGHGDIYVIDVASRKNTQITKSNEIDLFPEWSPDGHKIFYSSGSPTRHQLAYVSKSDEHWEKPTYMTRWDTDVLRPTLSPDGSVVAFYANNGIGNDQWNLHIVPWVPGKTWDESERMNTKVAENVVVDLNTGPTWSPNGHVLFYVASTSENSDSIFAWDFVHSRRYELNTKTKHNRDLRFSKIGVLSFRAQEGAWDRVYIALTNQGDQIQKSKQYKSWIKSKKMRRMSWYKKLFL